MAIETIPQAISKIDKLQILGVRSFDNHKAETIQFFTPLTLIVGHNGSGKTTIIECLKFATTGEQPAGTKGGAFVHDPKLCGEKEVLAQTRLSYKNTEGNRMVAVRNLQLTVKKNSRSLKALEGNLVEYKNGERDSVSRKVKDMDEKIPGCLGVSKAVLDSVIFCHQDESLWPMSEPSALKKRFDEIFEALKYTKAVDNLKVLRKGQGQELEKLKIVEENAKKDKDRGVQVQQKSEKLSAEIDELREECISLGKKLEEAQDNYDQAWEQVKYLGGIVGQLNGKRIEQRTKQENVQKLRRNLKELVESDEELQAMLEQYEDRLELLQQDVDQQKEHYMQLQRQLQQSRDTLSAKERECGSYEAEKANYDRQLEGREQLIKQTARRHGIRGFDLEIDDEQVRIFMERINRMARDQNAAFERARRETQQEMKSAQSALNRINEEKSALAQRKENARLTITSNDRKFNDLQSEMGRINIDEGAKVTLESAISDVESRLQKAKSDFDRAQWDQKFDSTEAALRSLEDQKENLDAEMIEGTKQAADSARLDYLRKELKERQQSLDTMTGAHGDKIKEVVGNEWRPHTLENDFARALEQRGAYVAEAERQRDGTNRELEQLRYKINACHTDLKSRRQDLQTSEQTVRDSIDEDPSEFPRQLVAAEKTRDLTYSDAENYRNLQKYYKDCMKTAQEHQVCRLCRRDFDKDKKAFEGFLKVLERNIKGTQKAEIDEDAQEAEAELKTLRAAGPAYDTWKRLTETEIPALDEEAARLKTRHESLTIEIEQHDQTVDERLEQKRDVEGLSKTVQTIVKYVTDITSLEIQIQELSSKHSSAGLSRGLEQIRDDIKTINEQTKANKSVLGKLTDDRDKARNLGNQLELDLRDAQSKLSTATFQLKEKIGLQKQIDGLRSANSDQRESIRSIDQDLQKYAPELLQAQAKYDEVARRGEQKDRQLQEETSSLNNSVSRLQMADKEISGYIERGGPQQLSRARSEIAATQSEIARSEKDMNLITREVKQTEGQLRNHEDTKRSICDNQDFRRDQRALEIVASEIQDLESHNAEAEKDSAEKQRRHWENEHKRLIAQNSSIVSTLKSKDDVLTGLLKDYDTEYKDAAYKFKEAHIRVETTKAVIEDLGRYGGALDKAIMKYHSLKMEEINRIIDELWRRTYQGTDVDTVLIRSENENVTGNKNYNYRVCMVKQDVEMDMRGRCSAGQKVLASIIIRLALAECFGVQCGLIALDEPTTNLDRDNIRALAESLAEIIRVRRQQSNFQLIVITHDEEFLRYMHCADFADYYYRIDRNEQQKSEILKQSIAQVL